MVDTTHIQSLLNQGNYADAYRAIAAQVEGNPAYHPQMDDWFRAAADINGPQQTWKKSLVFEYNRIAATL